MTRTQVRRKKNAKYLLAVILLCTAFMLVLGIGHVQGKSEQKPAARQPRKVSGQETFLKYCASCHGRGGKGDGPAAFALRPPPSDLTTLAKRHEGKYPSGYVSALLKFGRSLVAHGSEDMPVWGARFKTIDPDHDPTGQEHVDDVVVYIESLQAK
jgi:mono/diheme cytochrome c family protein